MDRKSSWSRVNRSEPCPVCGGTTWCTVSGDGSAARCMRVESDKPSSARDGTVAYLHVLADRPAMAPAPKKPAAAPVAKIDNVPQLAMSFRDAAGAGQKRLELARELRVSVRSLEAAWVGLGRNPDSGREFGSFPSRDGAGKIVGITRRFPDGRKLTYPGTSNGGVFACERWWDLPGPVFVVEGPSDVCAMHSAGLAAVGRSSNVAGAEVISQMLSRRIGRDRQVIVVCEDDRKSEAEVAAKTAIPHDPECPGCQRCWPGEYGARSVMASLVAAGWPAEYVRPIAGWKDARAMWVGGVLPEWLGLIGAVGCVYRSDVWEACCGEAANNSA